MRVIQRITITDAVVESIKELIESGEYEIGQKLPTESSFCEQLQVSRTSVREAFRVLQALNYVEIRPGKGAFAADWRKSARPQSWYDVQNVRFNDFMEVRMAIETLAVRLAVERASAKQVSELTAIHRAFVEAGGRADRVKLIMLDELFHTTIVGCTDNQLLININKEVEDCFRTYRSNSFTDPVVYANAIEPHGRILACFHDKNARAAVDEMRRHLEITAKDMGDILGHTGP